MPIQGDDDWSSLLEESERMTIERDFAELSAEEQVAVRLHYPDLWEWHRIKTLDDFFALVNDGDLGEKLAQALDTESDGGMEDAPPSGGGT